LFDLDGTLTDPGVGITNSVAYALNKYNICVTNKAELYKFIGPPLWDSFEKYYGFTKEQAKRAVEYYREYYRDKGIFENMLYDGIKDLLIKMKNAGKTLVVATSKPEVFAKQILEYFNINNYFTYIAGSNLDGTRIKKDEVISYALKSSKVDDYASVVMVGDREYDIIGANEIGVNSIGVLYGYGNYEELSKAGATYIAGSIIEIGDIILNI
jgi:phosphoglycolate phosphatase